MTLDAAIDRIRLEGPSGSKIKEFADVTADFLSTAAGGAAVGGAVPDTTGAFAQGSFGARAQERVTVTDPRFAGGAKLDQQVVVAGGAITATATTLTVTGAAFVTADVGKVILVAGAGAAGADLITTIASRTSGTVVELSDAAATTVTIARTIWGTDDTAAWQAALDYCCSSSVLRTLHMPAGGSIITTTLLVSSNFRCPVVVGEGAPQQEDAGGSRLVAVGIASGSSIVKVKGGSGKLSQGSFRNITFVGQGSSAGQYGITFADICGNRAVGCAFVNLDSAIQFYNESASGFTEFCVAENCRAVTCRHAARYTIAAGNSSFHGSGFDGMTFTGVSGYAAIYVERTGATNPAIYGAPMNITVFTATKLFESAGISGTVRARTFGAIGLESDGIALLTDDGTNHFWVQHSGTLNAQGQWANTGNRFQCPSMVGVCGASPSFDGLNNLVMQYPQYFRIRKSGIASGGTVSLANVKPAYSSAYLLVRTTASGHERQTLLLWTPKLLGTGGIIAVLATQTETDTAAIGTITYTIDASDNLVFTATPLNTTNVDARIAVFCPFLGRGMPWDDQS